MRKEPPIAEEGEEFPAKVQSLDSQGLYTTI